MAELSRHGAVLLDMAGCPNRCRHCYLGMAPSRRLRTDDLRRVVGAFREWRRPGEERAWFERLDVSSWYREPDYAPNYRELHDLELELSDGNVSRFELLSIWRLARDPTYAAWAREIGTEACQITFFGLEEATDWFTRRPGSFQDALRATERLIEVGIPPRWQVMLTRRFPPEAEAFVELVRGLRLEERVGEFGLFLNTASPDGEASQIEHLRVTAEALESLPTYLVEKTLRHFGVESLPAALGRSEAEHLPQMLECRGTAAERPGLMPRLIAFEVGPDFDVYLNLSEIAPWWRLGNLWQDGLDRILERFQGDGTPGQQAFFHVPVAELARRFGRADEQRL